MGTVTLVNCDGCQATLDPTKPETMWAGQLPLVSVPLTDAEKAQGKKRGKYSISDSVVCLDCREKLGDFIQSLKPAGE